MNLLKNCLKILTLSFTLLCITNAAAAEFTFPIIISNNINITCEQACKDSCQLNRGSLCTKSVVAGKTSDGRTVCQGTCAK
jgi:hypothetical protein